jgi:hypothetical protein
VTTKLTWTRLANGDLRCREHPIKIVKPASRAQLAPGWLVKTPVERDANYDDGWAWAVVYGPSPMGTPPKQLEGFSASVATYLAAEHLEHILLTVPLDYGQPESAPAPEPEPAPRHDPEWPCACGCGESVSSSRVYRPGHDARHRDQLVDLLVGHGSTRERANAIASLIKGLEHRS